MYVQVLSGEPRGSHSHYPTAEFSAQSGILPSRTEPAGLGGPGGALSPWLAAPLVYEGAVYAGGAHELARRRELLARAR